MVRNLKILLFAGMMLSALGALGGSSAQAAEFHCSVESCRVTVKPDGTGIKTGHGVMDFQVNGGSVTTITCSGGSGESTSATKTTTGILITSIVGENCNIGGQAATIDVNGCTGIVTSNSIAHGQCPEGKSAELTFGTCIVSFPPQTINGGVTFHNIGSEASGTTEVTVEVLVKGISGSTTAGCPGGAGTFSTGEVTTANAIATGETIGGVMANLWWK